MKFYKSSKWRKKRETILRRDNYLCQECQAIRQDDAGTDGASHLSAGTVPGAGISQREPREPVQ